MRCMETLRSRVLVLHYITDCSYLGDRRSLVHMDQNPFRVCSLCCFLIVYPSTLIESDIGLQYPTAMSYGNILRQGCLRGVLDHPSGVCAVVDPRGGGCLCDPRETDMRGQRGGNPNSMSAQEDRWDEDDVAMKLAGVEVSQSANHSNYTVLLWKSGIA